MNRRKFLGAGAGLLAAGKTLAALAAETDQEHAVKDATEDAVYELHPVGIVRKGGDAACVRIFDKYVDGLKGLDGFSHVLVFYWFHKNDNPRKRSTLQVHPRGDAKNPLTGVFACRAPVRPNLIALTLCKVLSVEGNVVRLDKIDAFDSTPVLDLKPYIPHIDETSKDVRLPDWLKR